MKYGVEVPASVNEAKALDAKNGNTLWQDAIAKEMKNNSAAFEKLEEGMPPPVGYKDIKMPPHL